jgi:ABC-type multidrug transport system fused ATPase/permease subunit
MCLARVLVKKTKILILDEATANIDKETDSKIQDAVRSHFDGITTLIIAHRLETVMDLDRVMVMKGGCVVEDGKPLELVHVKGSRFAKLAQFMGTVHDK